jgi:hypothetical protein
VRDERWEVGELLTLKECRVKIRSRWSSGRLRAPCSGLSGATFRYPLCPGSSDSSDSGSQLRRGGAQTFAEGVSTVIDS